MSKVPLPGGLDHGHDLTIIIIRLGSQLGLGTAAPTAATTTTKLSFIAPDSVHQSSSVNDYWLYSVG